MSALTDVTHRVLGSVDCTTAGCPNEADGDDGRCSQCRRPAPRDFLREALEGAAGERVPLPEPPPRPVRSDSLRLRQPEPAKEAPAMPDPQPRFICKINGCTERALRRTGPTAYLCDTHAVAAKTAHSERAKQSHAARRAGATAKTTRPSRVPKSPVSGGDPSLPAAARTRSSASEPVAAGTAAAGTPPETTGGGLVELAQAVETARDRVTAVEAELAAARSDVASALDRLREACEAE